MPVDLALVGVRGGLPGGELGVHDVDVVDVAVEALAGQPGQLDLGDVEPGAVLGLLAWVTGGSPAHRESSVRLAGEDAD